MKARQANKILRYAKGPSNKIPVYWLNRTVLYFVLIKGSLDHRINKALKIYRRHGRPMHFLDLPPDEIQD